MLVNPTNPRTELFIQQMQEPARLLGLRLQVLKASTDLELESAFSNLEQLGVGAVVVSNEPSYDHVSCSRPFATALSIYDIKHFEKGGVCGRLRPAPSHGENRGSSPLGSANKINNFCDAWVRAERRDQCSDQCSVWLATGLVFPPGRPWSGRPGNTVPVASGPRRR